MAKITLKGILNSKLNKKAEVVELVDTLHSECSKLKLMWVQIPSLVIQKSTFSVSFFYFSMSQPQNPQNSNPRPNNPNSNFTPRPAGQNPNPNAPRPASGYQGNNPRPYNPNNQAPRPAGARPPYQGNSPRPYNPAGSSSSVARPPSQAPMGARPLQTAPAPNSRNAPNNQAALASQSLLNEGIRAKEVRLISSTGEQLGIISTREALDRAKAENLDLVVIGVQTPPVAKIMDYGKFKFEKEKEEKEKKKKSKSQSLMKELKLTARIDIHDLQIKEKQACGWLEEGCKVRVVVKLKGRELQHPENARKLLQHVLGATVDFGKPDQTPPIKQEGQMFSLQLAPLNAKK